MPVSALSKKLASPRVPLMTLTTEESFAVALALPDGLPVLLDDEQPVSARARAEAAASPSFSWRFMCGISPCGLWPDDRPVVKRDRPLGGFRALGQLEVMYDLVAMGHTRGGSEAL